MIEVWKVGDTAWLSQREPWSGRLRVCEGKILDLGLKFALIEIGGDRIFASHKNLHRTARQVHDILRASALDCLYCKGGMKYSPQMRQALARALEAEGLLKVARIQVKPKYYDDGEFLHKEKGQYEVFDGGKKLGEVWKGLDGWWHTSNYRTGEGFRFRKRKDAVETFTNPESAPLRGKPVPVFEGS